MELAKKEQELKDKEALERSRKDARDEIGMLEGQTKVRLDLSRQCRGGSLMLCCLLTQDLDKRLNEAIAPIRAAESELSTLRADFTRDETAASRQLQAYNKSVEQLDLNKREIRRCVALHVFAVPSH